MQLLTNTLEMRRQDGWTRILGDVEATNDGDQWSLLSVDLDVPAVLARKFAGTQQVALKGLGDGAIGCQPGGIGRGGPSAALKAVPWSLALCLPDPRDLNRDGVIDGADIGLALAGWGGEEGDDGATLGQILAAVGETTADRLMAYGACSLAGAGSAKAKVSALAPNAWMVQELAVHAVLRLRLLVSPRTECRVTLDCHLLP